MSCELKYKGKTFRTEKDLKDYLGREISISRVRPVLPDRESTAAAPIGTMSKTEGDDKQIIMRLESKIDRLQNMINNPKINKFKLQEKIDQYREELKNFRTAPSLGDKLQALQNIATLDIIESEKLLENPDALNDSQINNIISTAELWTDVRMFIEVENLPTELEQLQVRASKIKLQASTVAIQLQIKQTEGTKSELTPDDVKLLHDDGFFGIITDIKNSRNKFIRFIGGALEKLGIRKHLKVQEMVKKSDDLFAKVSPADYDKLFKKDAKGRPMRNHFIYELDDSFFKTRNELNKHVKNFYRPGTKAQIQNVLQLSLNPGKATAFNNARRLLINRGVLSEELIDIAVAATNKHASNPRMSQLELVYAGMNKGAETARLKKNQWLAENTVVLNPKAFALDTTPAERDALLAAFKREVGNDHYAESRIRLAQSNIENYYRDQKQMREYLEEKHILSPTDFTAAMDQWEYQNNPFIYYNMTYDPGALDPSLDIDVIKKSLNYDELPYTPYAPRADVGNHYNPEFQELLKNKDLYNLYTFINNYMREAVKMLPADIRNGTNADFVLRAKSSAIEAFRANGNRPVDGSSFFVDWAAVNHNYEFINRVDELGNPLRKISFAKFQDIDKRILELEDIIDNPTTTSADLELAKKELKTLNVSYTTDLKATMEMMIRDVESYRFLNEAADATQIQLYLVNQAKEITGNGYKIQGLETTKMATQYTVDSILYGKYRAEPDQYKKDQFWEDNIFSNIDLLGFTSTKKKKAREIKQAATDIRSAYEAAMSKAKDKEKLTDDEREVIKQYNKYVEEYKNLGGKRSSWTKVADSFITWTQLKSLGFSILSPITNLNFGLASNYIEAAGGQFFNITEANAAFKEMLTTTRNFTVKGRNKSWKDNTKRLKIVNFLQSNNLIFDIMESQYGTGTKVSMDAAFTWLRSSDFFMKGQTIIASMMHEKIETKDGPKPMWAIVQQDGSIDESQLLEPFTEERRVNMIQKLNAIVKRTHGNTDTLSPVWAKKHVIGRLLGQFKLSWIAEGLNTRWNVQRDDEILGTRVQGRYAQLPRIAKTFINLSNETGATGLMEQWKAAFANLDEVDQADVRRIAMELAMVVSLMTAYLSLKMLLNSLDDDDKKSKAATLFALNMCYRLKQDLMFYFSIDTFADVLRNPIPATRVITDLTKALYKTAEVINPMEDIDEDDMESFWKNWAKVFPVTRQGYSARNAVDKQYEDFNNQ